jgi:hypothetical protein
MILQAIFGFLSVFVVIAFVRAPNYPLAYALAFFMFMILVLGPLWPNQENIDRWSQKLKLRALADNPQAPGYVSNFLSPFYSLYRACDTYANPTKSASGERPYGDINIFPWLSPVVILVCAYIAFLVELRYGAQLPKGTKEAIYGITTIFTYGILFISPISYVTFKNLFLPAINFMHIRMHIRSYFLNVIIVLIATEIVIVLAFASYRGFNKLASLFALAAIPTAVVALNCFGHICIVKFRSWTKLSDRGHR